MHSLVGMQQVCRAPGGGPATTTSAHIARSSSRLPSSLTRLPGRSATSRSESSLSASLNRDCFPCGWSHYMFPKSGAKGHGNQKCFEAERSHGGLLAEHSVSSYSANFLSCISIVFGEESQNISVTEDTLNSDLFHQGNDNELGLVESTVISLQTCRRTKSLAYARSVHLRICSSGLETHKAVENYIVPMFAECGSIEDAQVAFNKLACRKEHSWTSLISGYCDRGWKKHAFHIYRQMHEDGENPSSHTYAALLKAFTTFTCMEKGWEIHIEVVKEGLEKDISVGTGLIGMYFKCGSPVDALETFEDLLIQDISSWTTLIAGYAEHGPYKEALVLFKKMKIEGFCPDILTYTSSLKACGNMGAIDEGCELHTELSVKGLERDLFVGSALVCMYAKCQSLAEAQKVFEMLPFRDVVVWNVLISGYLDCGAGIEALVCYEKMKGEGTFPDNITYASILKACTNIGAIGKGREIHTELALVAGEGDFSVCYSLIGMYAKCGSLMEAQEVFDQSPVQDVAAWTSLITGYADHGSVQEALKCLDTLQMEGIPPDVGIFACSLKVCTNLGAVDKGQEIHMEVTKHGFEKELPVGKAMVSMYAKGGLILEAQKACDNLPLRDVVLWTALITGYAEHGLMEEVVNCLKQMASEGIAPNLVTLACALRAFGISGAFTKGQELHKEIALRGFEGDLLIGNALVGMYSKCHLFIDAYEVFNKLQRKDTVSWNTLIAGLSENGCDQEALSIFETMRDGNHFLDAVTFTCILKVCGTLGALGKGREIHAVMRESGFDRDFSVGNSLITMYTKCGSPSEAQEVFDNLLLRDVVAWSAMIKAYGMNHEGEKAVQCFKNMQEENVKPDAVTFSCLLLACSHASLVREGQEYLKVMREEYGIVPTIEHYSCVVDLFARSGYLYEAENFIMMACPPSEVIWGSLLTGCKTYGEVELGLRCFQKLVQINSGVAAWYVLMADVFVTAGRWDMVKRVEELRKHSGAIKKPASALIEINHVVHEFVVGENGDAEVSKLLSSLSVRLKQHGHLPNLEAVTQASTDMRKEVALCEHAEKLALAFGLLNTPSGVTLRVAKNLRMCNDCHSTSKVLSKVEHREIILRDDCCIHHFKNGFCSCGDSF